MALKVIEKECRVEDGRLTIVVEGDDPIEVTSADAKRLALSKAATFGYVNIGINNQSGSYPVDEQGNRHEDWYTQATTRKVAGYRNEIKLMAGL